MSFPVNIQQSAGFFLHSINSTLSIDLAVNCNDHGLATQVYYFFYVGCISLTF